VCDRCFSYQVGSGSKRELNLDGQLARTSRISSSAAGFNDAMTVDKNDLLSIRWRRVFGAAADRSDLVTEVHGNLSSAVNGAVALYVIYDMLAEFLH
jgi:hypothetical protein